MDDGRQANAGRIALPEQVPVRGDQPGIHAAREGEGLPGILGVLDDLQRRAGMQRRLD
jgi:hypothetical protein